MGTITIFVFQSKHGFELSKYTQNYQMKIDGY